MTDEERAKVIETLEIVLDATHTWSFRYPLISEALAIMQRDQHRTSQAGDIPDFGHPVGLPHP